MAEPIWKDIDDPNCSNLMDCCDYVDSIMQTLFISEVSHVVPAGHIRSRIPFCMLKRLGDS